jgi:hypothetical protein
MQTYTKWIDVRVCLALAAGALLFTWTVGCPPPMHPDNFGEGGGGVGDDDDFTGDDDDFTGDDDDDYNNVTACEDLADALSACGGFDFETDIGACAQYGEYACDLTPAFDCFENNLECLEGYPDFSAWFAAGCYDLLAC